MVLLTPCIDYVVTFCQLGHGDARLLLAATPILLIGQILLLPVYLAVLLGEAAGDLVSVGPFVHAFLWLILLPFVLTAAVQRWSGRGGGFSMRPACYRSPRRRWDGAWRRSRD